MSKNDECIDKKLQGATWNNIRSKLTEIQKNLLAVNDSVASKLMTGYIKYQASDGPLGQPFAVLWVKSAKQVVLGLATPEKLDHKNITVAPHGMVYKGLTSYLNITTEQDIPRELQHWVMAAYDHTKVSEVE
jgi:hypothetical protein